MRFWLIAFCLVVVAGPVRAAPEAAGGPIEVTADESLEWYQSTGLYVARGHARATRGDMTIEADILTAHQRKKEQAAKTADAAGMGDIDRLTAEGNVTVITKSDVARGDRAEYDVKQDKATLSGHVRITRGETQLTGDKAEVDFTRGESRLVNAGKGRVRALIATKSMKPKEQGGLKVKAQ